MKNWDQAVNEHNSIPEPDESWWASVLSDEAAVASEKLENNSKSGNNAQSVNITDWTMIKNVFLHDEVILLEVYGYNRGGLLVKGEGVQGFVPVSHLVDLPIDSPDDTKQSILAQYEGKNLYLKVIECEPASERVVLSERAAQAGEGKRKQLFESLKPGLLVSGVITNVTDFGVFVDLGGVEGLVHVSELSWGRVDQPSALFSVGTQVKVMVLQVNEGTARIALSIKRLSANPWDTLLENHNSGDTVSAVVTSIMRFGVFARLEEGIEGLIHISSIVDFYGPCEINRQFSVGQNLMVKILHIDVDRRRLGLGLVQEA